MHTALPRVAAIFFLAGLARADTVTITFDVLPGPDGRLGTPDDIPIVAPVSFGLQTLQLTDQFAAIGIIFTPGPPTNDKNEILNQSSFSVPPEATPPNLLASGMTATIEARFTHPVFDVGAILGISSGVDRLEIFDAANHSLGFITGDDTFQTLHSATPITRFVISALAGDTPAIDNLTFTAAGGTCYPNCDASTAPPILNVNDFQCFLNKFAAGESYANCDASTQPPTLNANDFQCFLNAFAVGCS